MNSDVLRLHMLMNQGYGCAQAIVKAGLELQGKENDDLICAMNGLGRGVRSGIVCGALTGGACLLSLFGGSKAAVEMIPDLVFWFEEECKQYNSINCDDILEGSLNNRPYKCPPLVEKVYLKVKEILAEYGIDMEVTKEDEAVMEGKGWSKA
jgi:hypothetical protein